MHNFVSGIRNSFTIVLIHSLTVPLAFSSFWRHLHSILSCRCHSGVCVIYHIKLINNLRIHQKFIYLARSITEIFQGCCRRRLRMFWNVSKSISLIEWKVACARFTLNTNLTTSQHICFWHRYGNLLLTEIWIMFLFNEGYWWCLLYRVWNLINGQSWTKIHNATVNAWFSWCLI